jgi:hypothetical protein
MSPISPRRAASIMSTILAVLVPLLVAAVVYLVLQNLRQDDELRRQAHAVVQQNVNARYDDCLSGERVRESLRLEVEDGRRTDPLLYKLIPALDTPEVRDLLAERRARQLRSYAPRDCVAYALSSVPEAQRMLYRVPEAP